MCLEKEKSENGIEIWANTDLSWNRDDFFSHQHGATYHSFHLPPRIQPLLSKYTGFVKMNLSHALKYEFSLSLNFMFNLPQTEKNEFCFQPQKTSASKYQFGLLLLLGAQCFSVYEKRALLNTLEKKTHSTRISDIWAGKTEFDDIWPFLRQGRTTVPLNILVSALSFPDLNDWSNRLLPLGVYFTDEQI